MIYTAGHWIETAEERFARRAGLALQFAALVAIAALCWLRPDLAARILTVLS